MFVFNLIYETFIQPYLIRRSCTGTAFCPAADQGCGEGQ